VSLAHAPRVLEQDVFLPLRPHAELLHGELGLLLRRGHVRVEQWVHARWGAQEVLPVDPRVHLRRAPGPRTLIRRLLQPQSRREACADSLVHVQAKRSIRWQSVLRYLAVLLLHAHGQVGRPLVLTAAPVSRILNLQSAIDRRS
jgi:hypothetical protein